MAITTAKGTLAQIGDGASPEVFSSIANIRSIAGPTSTAQIKDITTHSSTGNWMQKLAVQLDPGEATFGINFDKADATHSFTTGLWNKFINLTKRNYKIIFPASAGTLAFPAYVSSHRFNAPVDDVLMAEIALAISGAITAT